MFLQIICVKLQKLILILKILLNILNKNVKNITINNILTLY